MAKIIKYLYLEDEETEMMFSCSTQIAFDAIMPIVLREAYNGEYTVEGEFDPVPEEATTDEILNILLGVSE